MYWQRNLDLSFPSCFFPFFYVHYSWPNYHHSYLVSMIIHSNFISSQSIYLSYQLSILLELLLFILEFLFIEGRCALCIVRNRMISWNLSFQLTLISHERFCCWKDCLILFSPFFYLIWFSNFHVSYDKWSRLFSLVHILLLCMFLQIEPRCFMSTISLL